MPSRCSPADLAENLVENQPSLVCDCGNREAISKPGVPCQASIADQRLRRDHRQWRPIGLAFGQHRPCDASHLVGQCDSRDVGVNSRCKLAEPCTETRRLLVPALQHGACSAHEQSSQVVVSALADAEQLLLAARRLLLRNQPQPGSKWMSGSAESRNHQPRGMRARRNLISRTARSHERARDISAHLDRTLT